MSINAASLVLGYQVVQFRTYIFSAVVLIIPFRYLLCDVISEVYGFHIAKKIVFYMIIYGFIFSLLMFFIVKLPAPSYWTHRSDYNFVLGNTLHIACYCTIGVFIGSVLNIYFVSKWKVLTKGKYFWLRSLGGSCIGELIQYAITISLMFHTFLNSEKVFGLVVTDYFIQVVILMIFSPIAHFCMFWLKNYEGIDDNQHAIKVDPF